MAKIPLEHHLMDTAREVAGYSMTNADLIEHADTKLKLAIGGEQVGRDDTAEKYLVQALWYEIALALRNGMTYDYH